MQTFDQLHAELNEKYDLQNLARAALSKATTAEERAIANQRYTALAEEVDDLCNKMRTAP